MPVARRSLIEGWDPEIELIEDVTFNLKLFDRLSLIPTIAEPLHDYRVRQGSICHSDQSAEIADRGYVLETGQVILEGKASELVGNDLVRQAYLGG